LSFGISKSSFVSLKIYDIIGNEIASLVNEEKKTGRYEVKFLAPSFLASGIYLYQLTAGEFISTRKFIFLK